MNPPPCLIQSRSTFSKRLSQKKITVIRTRPTANEKPVKSCTYFAACETRANASGPISGNSKVLPKGMLRPGKARATNDTAVSQCANLSRGARFGVGNVDASFDAGGLLQQRLFIDDAGRWVRGAIRTEFLKHFRNRSISRN